MIRAASTGNPSMLRPALALSALLAFTAPVLAQQKMTWHTQDSDDGAALIFGVQETDEAMLFFLCKTGSQDVVVQSMIGSKGLAKDAAARIVLSAGGTKKTFAGKAVANEESGAVDVEAAGKMADVKALAKAGSLLTVEVKGATQKISLAGAPAAAEKFEAACKPKS